MVNIVNLCLTVLPPRVKRLMKVAHKYGVILQGSWLWTHKSEMIFFLSVSTVRYCYSLLYHLKRMINDHKNMMMEFHTFGPSLEPKTSFKICVLDPKLAQNLLQPILFKQTKLEFLGQNGCTKFSYWKVTLKKK